MHYERQHYGISQRLAMVCGVMCTIGWRTSILSVKNGTHSPTLCRQFGPVRVSQLQQMCCRAAEQICGVTFSRLLTVANEQSTCVPACSGSIHTDH